MAGSEGLTPQEQYDKKRNNFNRFIVWCIMGVILIATVVPCMTFYIVLRENWSEVSSLQHQLLQCQFSRFADKNNFLAPLQEIQGDFPQHPTPEAIKGSAPHPSLLSQKLQEHHLIESGLQKPPAEERAFLTIREKPSVAEFERQRLLATQAKDSSIDLFANGISNEALEKDSALDLDDNFKHYFMKLSQTSLLTPNLRKILNSVHRNDIKMYLENPDKFNFEIDSSGLIIHKGLYYKDRRSSNQIGGKRRAKKKVTKSFLDNKIFEDIPNIDDKMARHKGNAELPVTSSLLTKYLQTPPEDPNQMPKRRTTRDASPEFLTAHPSQTTTVQVPDFDRKIVVDDQQKLNDRPGVDQSFSGHSPRHYRTLLNRRLTNINSSEPTPLDEEYVRLLERQVKDLRARVKSCRSCLPRTRRKSATCGGGAGWRQHRRQEKIMRRQMKLQKKKDKQNHDEEEVEDGEEEGISTEESNGRRGVVRSLVSTERKETPTTFVPTMTPHQARENRRMSTDFRRGFNQKIVRMDEALQQFSETQSAFCKELRDNLGARLEKRGLELGALSEQVAALVRTTTKQIAMLEMLTSDQVYGGQQDIEKSLANLLTLKDSQVRFIKGFHTTTLLPGLINLNTLLSDHASTVTALGVDMITRLELLQDSYMTHVTRQADTLQKLAEEVDTFAPKHTNLFMRGQDLATRLHANAEAFVREIQNRMNNVVKELVVIRVQSQNFVNFSDSTLVNITTALNQTEQAVDNHVSGLKERIAASKDRDVEFRKEFSVEAEHITARVESGVSTALATNHQALLQIEESELESRRFINAAAASWTELYMNQEHELRLDADQLSNNLQSFTHHTQNILTGLNNAAQTHEQVLEEQRMDFQRFVRKRQEALDSQCMAISDWSGLMSSELRRRDEDLHRFLSDGLHYSLMPEVPDQSSYTAAPSTGINTATTDNEVNQEHVPPTTTLETDGRVTTADDGHRRSGDEGDNSKDTVETNKSSEEEQTTDRYERKDGLVTNTDESTEGFNINPELGKTVRTEEETTEATFNKLDYETIGGDSEGNLASKIPHHGLVYGQPEDIDLLNGDIADPNARDEKHWDGVGSQANESRNAVNWSQDQSKGESKQEIDANENLTGARDRGDQLTFSNGTTEEQKPDSTSYAIHGYDGGEEGEQDEGFIKLRTILDAAERSILEFQNDIHVATIYDGLREADFSNGKVKSWLRPNGRFEVGFWESKVEQPQQENFVEFPFKGTPRKSVWTPPTQETSDENYTGGKKKGNNFLRKELKKKKKHLKTIGNKKGGKP